MTTLGIGLIGCGDIAPTHARAIQAAGGVRLAACMDVIEASARSLGEEYGIPHTTSADDLLGREDVGLVVIATPAHTHADLTERAAAAGKAVLCEKPLAATLSDADRMIAATRRAGVPLSTCFPLRYLPGARWISELLSTGALGRVIAARVSALSEKKASYWTGGFSGRTQTEWRRSRQSSGGGVIITNLIHNLDLVRAITGLEVRRASAEAGTFCTQVEVEDLGVAVLRYDNDAIGLVEGCSCFFGGGAEWDLVLLGTRGQARLRFWGGDSQVFLTEPAAGLPAREWVKRHAEANVHVALYEALADALRAGQPPPVTGEDGRRALEVVLAIYRAAQSGQPVALPLEP